MNITQFKVTKNEIQRTAPTEARIVAGSVSTDAVQFEFDPDPWADLTATAVFAAGDVEKSVLLTDKSLAYEIPHEVMASAGVCLRVGVFGVDVAGQVIVPTTYAKVCDVILGGANLDAEPAVSDTDSIYAQWVASVAADAAAAKAAAAEATRVVETVEDAAKDLADAVDLAENLEENATSVTQGAIAAIEAAAETQMEALQEIGAKAPILSEANTWLIWDAENAIYQDTGVAASGAAFTYADFTAAQLAALKGEKGDTGAPGADGTNGLDGADGAQGETGAQGAAFTYADFTAAQLAALKGEKGDTGAAGADGANGLDGADGAPGETGAQGNPTIVNGLSGASITLSASDIALTGYTAASEASAIAPTDTVSEAIAKLAAASASASNGISVYTHSSSNGTHTLTGSGENGKFKATVTADASAFAIGSSSYTTVQGASGSIALTEGRWYTFLLDDAAGTINFPSANGSGALALKVVGGTTQPTSPAEGTVWIETAQLGNILVQSDEPTAHLDGTALASGDVWLQSSLTGTVVIQKTTDPFLEVKASNTCRFDGETWNTVPSSFYHDAQWCDLTTSFYAKGTAYQEFSTASIATGVLTYNDNDATFYVDSGAGTGRSSTIYVDADLTDMHFVRLRWSAAYVFANALQTGTFKFGAATTATGGSVVVAGSDANLPKVAHGTTDIPDTAGEFILDVSALSGTHYLKIFLQGSDQSYGSSARPVIKITDLCMYR